MIARAEITQLENNGLYFNLLNKDYEHIGVWTAVYNTKAVLYKSDNIIYLMQFKTDEARKEFESNTKNKLKILWDSRS